MAPQGSVTRWIDLLKAGDSEAVGALLDRYLKQLEAIAQRRLRGVPCGAGDHQDVAQSAFWSFYQGVERGAFPRLMDRHDLLNILVLITARKAFALVQRERRQKRGGGKVVSASDLANDEQDIAEFLSREPAPDSAAEVAEEWQRLLGLLPSDEVRAVAQGKLEGYTNEELADRHGCTVRTVERRVRVIRSLWSEET